MNTCAWPGCFRRLPIGARSSYCTGHSTMADEWTCPVCSRLVDPSEEHETTGHINYHKACFMPNPKGKT